MVLRALAESPGEWISSSPPVDVVGLAVRRAHPPTQRVCESQCRISWLQLYGWGHDRSSVSTSARRSVNPALRTNEARVVSPAHSDRGIRQLYWRPEATPPGQGSPRHEAQMADYLLARRAPQLFPK